MLALARPSPDIELLAYTVPPRAVSSRFVAHKPGSREIFHVLSGRLEVHVAQETVTLGTGDTVILRVDYGHWFANVGDDPVRLILTALGS